MGLAKSGVKINVILKVITTDESSNVVTTFEGYKLKVEVIPMLRKVGKHGDITKDSSMHDPDFLTFFLEKLCWIVWNLEHTRIEDVTVDMVENMCKIVLVLEKIDFNVGWPHTMPSYINGVHDKIKDYAAWGEERMDNVEKENARLAVKQREVCDLEKKVKAMEHETEEARDNMKPMSETYIVDGLF